MKAQSHLSPYRDPAVSHCGVYICRVLDQRLSSLDLNLLVSLDALLRERNVTRAAERLRLSQPSMSSALARLRRHFGDQLLLRVGNRFELTPLARQLVDRTSVALSALDLVFAASSHFDPHAADREFSLIMSDYILTVLGPALVATVCDRAPHVRLRFQQIRTTTLDEARDAMLTVDGIVLPHGYFAELPHLDLFRDTWHCVVSANNPAVGDELTVDNLAELPWVVTFYRSALLSTTMPFRQVTALGIQPTVQIVVESFLAIPTLVAGSNRIGLIHSRHAADLAPIDGIRVLPCPFDPAPLIAAFWWHPVYQQDPGHQWLREVLVDAARTLPENIVVPG